MYPKPRRLVALLIALGALCSLPQSASAKAEHWKNAKGEDFEASASQILGPWAVFDDGTLVPLNAMSKEDCVRFYQALKGQPERAANWKDATSPISFELYGRLMHYQGDSLVGDDENGRPEPEFFIMFFTKEDHNQSWDLLSRSTPALYSDLVKKYPELVQGVVFGYPEETIQDFMDVATNTKGEWMFTKFDEEVKMRTLQKLVPTNQYGIVVMTRMGVPLFGPDSTTDEQVKAIFANFTGLLGAMRPNDTKVWIAQAHYLASIQPVAFAEGHSDPVLVGNPLNVAILRKMKISKVDATFTIGADGAIQNVVVQPNGMAPATVDQFTAGFKRSCLFVPAVDHGKFVAGTYTYHVDVP